MKTQYDHRVEEYHKLENGGYLVKLKFDQRIDDYEISKKIIGCLHI